MDKGSDSIVIPQEGPGGEPAVSLPRNFIDPSSASHPDRQGGSSFSQGVICQRWGQSNNV